MARVLCTFALLICAATAARAQCGDIPGDVQQYLRFHPGWMPVTDDDLTPDAKADWTRQHPGLCPGLAVAEIAGNRGSTYALALRNSESGDIREQLVMVRREAGRVIGDVVVQPASSAQVETVWRVRPGTYFDQETMRNYHLPFDSLVYGIPGGRAALFYYSNGKFRSILIAN
jgi:hypothetical protein